MILAEFYLVLAMFMLTANASPPQEVEQLRHIISKHCVECHREQGMASRFSYKNLNDVFRNFELIQTVVSSGLMPPWQFAPLKEYSNNFSLTQKEQEFLTHLVLDERLKKSGHLKLVRPSPGIKNFNEHESIFNLSLKKQRIELNKPNDLMCLDVSPKFKTRQYVGGVYLKFDKPQLIHHTIVHVVPKEVEKTLVVDSNGRVTCDSIYKAYPKAYSLGEFYSVYPEGTGIPIEVGSKIFVEVHYNKSFYQTSDKYLELLPLIKIESEVSSLGFHISFSPPEASLNIPADAKQHIVLHKKQLEELRGIFPTYIVPKDDFELSLHKVVMHMHGVGEETALSKVGSSIGSAKNEKLAHIPKWEQMAEPVAWFEKPIPLGPKDSLELKCVYNNSKSNLKRPLVEGRSIAVKWGWGPNDEMCVTFLYISIPITSKPS